jgi:hypothetical protein
MLTKDRIAQGLTAEWTAEDRLLAIAALLPGLSQDIYANRYSAMGRPNITSLQHIIHEPAAVLEEQAVRQELAPVIAAFQEIVARW